MKKIIFPSIHGMLAALMMLAVLSVGSAQAAGTENSQTLYSGNDTHGAISGMLLAANDTQKADASSKSVKAANGKKAEHSKDTEASKQAGPPPSKYWIVNVLRAHPELVLFLTLALGYYVGGIKMGSFSLGAVTGTLLVGVLIGQLEISISPQIKSMFFTMFLFAIGYSVGPQFVRGVAKDGAPQAIFAVVISVLALGCTYVAAKLAGFDVGLAAGLLAGAQTISASIGLATTAINTSEAFTLSLKFW